MIKKKTPMLDKALQQEEPKIIEVRGQKFFEHKLPNGGTFYDISANIDSGITPTSRPTTQGIYGSGEVTPITYEDILLHRELYLKYMEKSTIEFVEMAIKNYPELVKQVLEDNGWKVEKENS